MILALNYRYTHVPHVTTQTNDLLNRRTLSSVGWHICISLPWHVAPFFTNFTTILFMAEIVCYVSCVCYVNFDLFRFNQLNAIGAKFWIHFEMKFIEPAFIFLKFLMRSIIKWNCTRRARWRGCKWNGAGSAQRRRCGADRSAHGPGTSPQVRYLLRISACN